MTYEQLLDFVQDYMPKRMQHIYLPLLIGELVDSDGSATIRQLAEAVLAKDESQVMYYEKRLKEMQLNLQKKVTRQLAQESENKCKKLKHLHKQLELQYLRLTRLN